MKQIQQLEMETVLGVAKGGGYRAGGDWSLRVEEAADEDGNVTVGDGDLPSGVGELLDGDGALAVGVGDLADINMAAAVGNMAGVEGALRR